MIVTLLRENGEKTFSHKSNRPGYFTTNEHVWFCVTLLLKNRYESKTIRDFCLRKTWDKYSFSLSKKESFEEVFLCWKGFVLLLWDSCQDDWEQTHARVWSRVLSSLSPYLDIITRVKLFIEDLPPCRCVFLESHRLPIVDFEIPVILNLSYCYWPWSWGLKIKTQPTRLTSLNQQTRLNSHKSTNQT